MSKQQKLKVAAYCRVSTKMEIQQFSLGYQQKYYETLIQQNSNWEYVGIYVDSKSGTNFKKRPQFNAMLKDCKKGKIDMILTKSVSRFCRNTLEFLGIIRLLKDKRINVYFETEHIWLLEEKTEFQLSCIAAIAQEESESKSRNIKWGMKVGMESGTSGFANKKCYGYAHDDFGNLVINPSQAETVKHIFEWYLGGDSLSGISERLLAEKILSPTGKDRWTSGTLNKVLSNEKYTGDVLLQKTYISDFWNHTQSFNKGKFTQYLYESNHTTIISGAIFEAVQTEKKARSNLMVEKRGKVVRKSIRFNSGNTFSGSVVCGECGKNYRYITTHSGEIVWRCVGRVEKSKIKCQSRTVKQDEIDECVMQKTGIVDLHLDFLPEIVAQITVGADRLQVVLKDVSPEKQSELLHLQDHWLCQHSIAGDKVVGEKIYVQHKALLEKHLYFLTMHSKLNHADIEELSQNVWLYAFRNMTKYNSQYRFWTWMKQIVKHEFYSMLRKSKRIICNDELVRLASEKRQLSNMTDIDCWIGNEQVASLLSVLTEVEREIIKRYVLSGETQASIAKSIQLSTSRVSQIYIQALQKMKAEL